VETKPRVLLIATQDTKQAEGGFLRQCLEESGCQVIHLDASVRKTLGGAEIAPEAVAQAAGMTIEQVRAIGHEGKILDVMIDGAVKQALALNQKESLSGIIALGGSMGTTLGTAVMRAFPIGIPKLMISTLASGMTAGFVGFKDIMMLYPVCDVAGINSITREVYRNGAFAMAGMAQRYRPSERDNRPLVLVSTLGTLEACMQRLRGTLEADGYEVLVFHTLGIGGQTLDAVASERDVAAIVDMSLVEINDLLHGGICSAGPARACAGPKRGIPTIFAPGNVDFYIMPTALTAVEKPFEGRRYHIHNPALTAVRTTEQDLERLADHMAGVVKDAAGPVKFFVPLGGFSNHDSPQGHIHDPSLPPLFADYLKKVMPSGVDVQPVPAHINDPAFADRLIEAVRSLARTGAAA
jgi:uncharacterized protein (UPF0261 family)